MGVQKSICVEVGQLLAQHPKPGAEGCQYFKEKRQRQLKVRVRGDHQWEYRSANEWQCIHCLRVKRAEQSELDWTECKQLSATLQRMGGQAGQLALAVAVVERTNRKLFICLRCGGLAECHAKLLAEPVCLPPLRQQRHNLSMVAQGRHPNGRERVHSLTRLYAAVRDDNGAPVLPARLVGGATEGSEGQAVTAAAAAAAAGKSDTGERHETDRRNSSGSGPMWIKLWSGATIQEEIEDLQASGEKVLGLTNGFGRGGCRGSGGNGGSDAAGGQRSRQSHCLQP